MAAKTFGFRSTDGDYFYSYYGGPSSYNIGTCVAGSVRVRFESKSFFRQMSLIGKLNGYKLEKVEKLLLSEDGSLTATDLIADS